MSVPARHPTRQAHRRRWVLRPGVHVLRRSADELQVGLDPARALVLPDLPAVRATLTMLGSPASPPPEEYDVQAVDLLAQAGLLVDADQLLPLLPTGPRGSGPGAAPGRGTVPALRRSTVAAVAAVAGDATAGLLDARRAARVDVRGAGAPVAREVATQLSALLEAAGLPCTMPGPGRLVGVLVCVGEPAREEVDGWMRDGVPHLLVRLTEAHAVVGPFVTPGVTACLRCLDAHHTDLDPAWPLLVAQQATAVTRSREDTVPEPLDPLLAALACAWAAREVASHTESRTPATASTTLRLDPRLTALETQTWPRHPACGCAGI